LLGDIIDPAEKQKNRVDFQKELQLIIGDFMTNRTPAMLSAILTFAILILTGVLLFLGQIIALNGVINENQAFTAIGLGIGCQCVAMFLAAGLAGWLSNVFIHKFYWNKTLAVTLATSSGVVLGIVVSFISTILSFPVVGIR
jgi:hypothetical protein